MFCSDKLLSVRDLGAYWNGNILFDDVEFIDWATSAHFRIDSETRKVTLGGDPWGTDSQLVDLAVMQFGVENGKFTVYINEE